MTTLMIPTPGPWNSCEDRVLIALADRDWHSHGKLSTPEIGGYEVTRCIRALHDKGWNIEQKKVIGEWWYRLVIA